MHCNALNRYEIALKKRLDIRWFYHCAPSKQPHLQIAIIFDFVKKLFQYIFYNDHRNIKRKKNPIFN